MSKTRPVYYWFEPIDTGSCRDDPFKAVNKSAAQMSVAIFDDGNDKGELTRGRYTASDDALIQLI